MKFKFERKKSITLSNNYVPINDQPQTLEEALNMFVGEVNNAATRARIQFTLDRYNIDT